MISRDGPHRVWTFTCGHTVGSVLRLFAEKESNSGRLKDLGQVHSCDELKSGPRREMDQQAGRQKAWRIIIDYSWPVKNFKNKREFGTIHSVD